MRFFRVRPTLVAASSVLGLALIPTASSRGAVRVQGNEIMLDTARYALAFDAKNGALLRVVQSGQRASIWRSGEHGLWRVRFRDNSEAVAAQFSANSATHRFRATPDAKNNALDLNYSGDELQLSVRVVARPDGAEFRAQVQPAAKTILDLDLPARLRFEAAAVKNFVFPMNGNQGIGVAFKKSFFSKQDGSRVAAWQNATSGATGYTRLFGAPPQQRPDNDPPVALSLTDEGRAWLGDDFAATVSGRTARVNRAPQDGQADLNLITSPNGSYLSASRLGGKGALWRIGGFVNASERVVTVPAIGRVVEKVTRDLSTQQTGAPLKIGLLRLPGAPFGGAGSDATVAQWFETLNALPMVRGAKAHLVELNSLAQIQAAMRDPSFAAILNPYGEFLPVANLNALPAMVDAIGAYVKGGGNWMEVGGYSFYTALSPAEYLDYFQAYPSAIADFLYLDSALGQASVFGVQPRSGTPWVGAANKNALFVPGKLRVGGDARGGFADRTFGTWVDAGQSWRSPLVFMKIGGDASTHTLDYAAQNGVTRPLADKMPAALLSRFKAAPLIYLQGNAREKIGAIPFLPPGSLVHFADYLNQGFDRGLPDLLPPNPAFGTSAEFSELFSKMKSAGHLVMPYTNTTWWSNPKGKTWTREGDAPLVKLPPDNRLSYERYGENDGYTATPWHPSTQRASREAVRQFTQDFPVDILFQDQIGARPWIMSDWLYDMNPASPTPYAYIDGLLSQGEEDARRAPLSTEAGWDKIINFEAQMCGFTFDIMPSAGYEAPGFWTRFPADTEMFPLIQLLAHDKAALHYHDLGQFIRDPEGLSWMLALGFGVNAHTSAVAARQESTREWLAWLQKMQSVVAARYTGQPIRAWQHARPADPQRKGVVRATYGDVKIVANLDGVSTQDDAQRLAPFGFRATAPGLIAEHRAQKSGEAVPFIAQTAGGQTDVWIYSPQNRAIEIELPAGAKIGALKLRSPQTAMGAKPLSTQGRAVFTLPRLAGAGTVDAPTELASRAPLQWSQKPAIGVIDLGDENKPGWTNIQRDDWLNALRNTQAVKSGGARVEMLSTQSQIAAALREGARRYLVIVNPYGETFPLVENDWKSSLTLIKNYVRNGGHWWEVAGQSFTVPARFDGASWKAESAIAGAAEIGLPIASGAVEQAPEPLQATPAARDWLGETLSTQVAQNLSAVNRSLSRGSDDPGHVALIGGRDGDFIGGYDFGGWGKLWRIGGFGPNPQVALPVVAAVTDTVFATSPAQLPVAQSGGINRVWHFSTR